MGVKVSYDTKKDGFPDMIKRLEAVNGSAVEVGVLKGEHKWLAGIHEYGANIKPGRAQYLTVPLTPEAAERKAGSYSNTFVYTSKKGNKFIARKSGDELELLYWLTKEVNIPPRPFLKPGYDKNRDAIMKKATKLLADVAAGKTTERGLCQAVGMELRDRIKDYATELHKPPNSSITTGNKGTDNPLVKTGDMIGGITWRKAK